MSIECGHNFCRGCLKQNWAPGGGSFPCPECRQPSSSASLRPNWALGRLVEKARRGRQGPVSPSLCCRHGEPLRLFCEDDQRPVCLVCRESQEHQAHTLAPIDEAFESYRVSWPLGEMFTVYLNFHKRPSRWLLVSLETWEPLETQKSYATCTLELEFQLGVEREAQSSSLGTVFKGLPLGTLSLTDILKGCIPALSNRNNANYICN